MSDVTSQIIENDPRVAPNRVPRWDPKLVRANPLMPPPKPSLTLAGELARFSQDQNSTVQEQGSLAFENLAPFQWPWWWGK